MKKIIKGAQYNTDTAREIGRNGEKVLYKTKAGKYFLHDGGGQINPLTMREAESWAGKYLTDVDCAKEFGVPGEAEDGREALNISVPADIKAKLERMRSETGKSISRLITEIIGGI